MKPETPGQDFRVSQTIYGRLLRECGPRIASLLAPAAAAPTVASPAKSGELTGGLAYLARQVWIVGRKEGIGGVIRAARRRRAAVRLLRYAPPAATPRPGVSIIIPVFNNLEFTRACMERILRHSGNTPLEIIVVDNGSIDDTPLYLLK